jgi:hypothetical protein
MVIQLFMEVEVRRRSNAFSKPSTMDSSQTLECKHNVSSLDTVVVTSASTRATFQKPFKGPDGPMRYVVGLHSNSYKPIV